MTWEICEISETKKKKEKIVVSARKKKYIKIKIAPQRRFPNVQSEAAKQTKSYVDASAKEVKQVKRSAIEEVEIDIFVFLLVLSCCCSLLFCYDV